MNLNVLLVQGSCLSFLYSSCSVCAAKASTIFSFSKLHFLLSLRSARQLCLKSLGSLDEHLIKTYHYHNNLIVEGHGIEKNLSTGYIPLNQTNTKKSVFTKVNEVMNSHLTKTSTLVTKNQIYTPNFSETHQPQEMGYTCTHSAQQAMRVWHQVSVWATHNRHLFSPT